MLIPTSLPSNIVPRNLNVTGERAIFFAIYWAVGCFAIKYHSLHQVSPCYNLKWASDHTPRGEEKKIKPALSESLTDP